MVSSATPPNARRIAIGNRYRLAGVIGEGGMAVVYQAVDTSTGKHIALKQMRAPSREHKRAQMTELFEREYLTLAQLTHPRVVEVYDYGVDVRGPYYTMELLDGGDLHHLAPLAWQQACVLARDVCSVLSLLHSRHLVYRDLSPRNVRCTLAGPAKLIDFGAMTPMAAARELVGTPPCLAPEALACRTLDARSDLYALGATLYYALTRRQAYPAHSFAQLWEVWRTPPPPPSTFAPHVPEALDRLVMGLIQMEPALRPNSAAEVMERLAAIADLPADEHLSVHQAYLSTPVLVGRDAELAAVRERTVLTSDQPGASVLVHGVEGSGRSRMLDACVLDAKLSGMIALRADAMALDHKPYAALRTLVAQLLEQARDLAMELAAHHASPLREILPELCAAPITATFSSRPDPGLSTPAVSGEEASRAAFSAAAVDLLLRVAAQRPLLIAIDDFTGIDEASALLVAQLAQEAPLQAIGIAATTTSRALRDAKLHSPLATLATRSSPLSLPALDATESKELLGSVFGDVPNLHVLASYADEVAAGNPRDIMRLAKHLVDEDIIRYAAGTWSIPEGLASHALPSSMAEARKVRLSKLGRGARRLAFALSSEPRQNFSFDECLELSQVGDPSEALSTLRELLDAGVSARSGARYRLAQLGFFELSSSVLSEAERQEVHRCLARIFEQREDGVRTAQHFFRAGDDQSGLAALVLDAKRNSLRLAADSRALFEVLRELPKDWTSVYDHALQLCTTGETAHERDALLSRLNGFISHAVRDTNGFVYLRQRLSLLEREVGLDLYATLPDTLPPAERLQRALALAGERYRGTPEARRTREPLAAIKPLASTLLAALGAIAFSNDHAAFCELPSLAPLVSLSPALFVVDQIALGLGARITARSELAIAIYERLLTRISQPDRAGLQVSEHALTQQRITLSLGATEAALGLARCRERIEVVLREPEYETQALMLRQLYQLWQGDGDAAAETQRTLELRKGEHAHHGFEGQHLLSELCAYALADDLTHIKQATDTAASHARIYAAWVPVLHYGRGEYHRIRGDGEAALTELRTALSLMPEEKHQLWANAVGAELRVLIELRRYAEVVTLARKYLARSGELGLGYVRSYMRMPLSVALSALGEAAAAEVIAQGVVDDFLALGSTGLNLALAYETRARVALAADDASTFQRCATLSAEQWRGGTKRLLDARYAQRAAERAAKPMDRATKPSRLRLMEQGSALRSIGQEAPITDVSLILDSQVASFSSLSLLTTPSTELRSTPQPLRPERTPSSSIEP